MTDLAGGVSGLSFEDKRALAAELLRRREERRAQREHRLSFGQRAWWFLHRLDPENPSLGVAFAARIRSSVDPALLRRCFLSLVERHDVLRTIYAERDGQPVQVIQPGPEPCFEVLDAAGRSWPEAVGLLAHESLRPFDLARGPVVRLTLASRAEDDHGLLLVVHHIAADLWSIVILLDELRTLYEAAGRGLAAMLPPLPKRYVDFAEAEAAALSGPRGERHWEYWQQRLADPPALALPTDRPRRSARVGLGAAYELPVGEDLAARLRALGAEQGATFFMVLLAAYDVLLSRHTGQRDLVVGSLVAKGRSHPDLAGVVGFLDNPVALRESLDDRLPFSTFLDRVRQTVLEAMEHQEYPFSLVVERLRPVREAGRASIFQTMLILQAAHVRQQADLLNLWFGSSWGEAVDFGGLRLEPVTLNRGAANALAGELDLSLAIADLGGRLSASFQYHPDLFDRATVARMALRFGRLLESIVAAPERRLADLDLLAAAERHQVLAEWNDTRRSLPGGACLHDLFAERAEACPGAPAVLGAGEPVTYGELARRAGDLARHLRGLGVGPEVRVGLCVQPSVHMVVGLLAVLEAGGAYVPIDPRYPAARRELLVQDAEIRLLLTEERLQPGLPAAATPLPADVSGGNLAYVIYTSGSTGRPKGVMIDHGAAANTVLDINRRFGIGPGDRVFAVSSLSFDLSVYDIFGTLAAGAAVVLPQPSAEPSPELWLDSLERYGVTVWSSAPALLEMLHQHTERRQAALPPTLRLVLLSGDWIPVALPEQIRRQVAGASVISLGGATEASIWSIFHPVERGRLDRASIPYGRPLSNQRFHVLDGDLEPAPVGVVGDLYIGGDGVARGYQGRPDLTAERFLPDPFDPSPQARLYRTGDLGRYLANGEIEFLGRADHQVKIRGFRVELGEIEARLASHPGIREALALVRDDTPGGRQLTAYYTTAAGEPPIVEALRRHLREALPEYMVPTFLVRLDAFPLTPNGKVDRRTLPAPVPLESHSGGGPRTPVEADLVRCWQEVLAVPGVGIGDDFFALGGDSLTASRLLSRIKTLCGVDLPLRALFAASTPEALAPVVAERRNGCGEKPAAAPGAPAAEGRDVFPLSWGQRALWYLHQIEPESAAYNCGYAARLHSPVDAAALRNALQVLVDRHPALRTTYALEKGETVQRERPGEAVAFTQVEAAGWGEDRLREEVLRAHRAPFDLAGGPLFRACLFTRGGAGHVLLMGAHHAACDGWSLFLLLDELRRLYPALCAGSLPDLGPPLPGYAEYVLWQQSVLDGETGARLWAYWRDRLAGDLPVLDLPIDRPRPAVPGYRGAWHRFSWDADLSARLRRLAHEERATLSMVLTAGFAAVLYRLSGQDEILLGTTTSGRSDERYSRVVGTFTNPVVLRVGLSGDPSFRGLLRAVRNTSLEAFEHQDFPFPLLVERLQPQRVPGRAPVYQVSLIVQNLSGLGAGAEELYLGGHDGKALNFGGLLLEPYPLEPQAGQSELDLEVFDAGACLSGTLQYDADLFLPDTIARIAGRLAHLLAAAAASPELRLGELDEAVRLARSGPSSPVAAESRLGRARRQAVRLVPASGESGN